MKLSLVIVLVALGFTSLARGETGDHYRQLAYRSDAEGVEVDVALDLRRGDSATEVELAIAVNVHSRCADVADARSRGVE